MKVKYETPVAEVIDFCALEKLAAEDRRANEIIPDENTSMGVGDR